ncbi:hypothetical protein E8E95_17270 [Pseudomonas sp. BN414]|uniref:hypothetical protein n=1 Tax=Pseudomonas sp. BN414 TaxID=2567888 RepID=UPI002458D0B0|nr:hypothetical protein [Pseudomonas sp. BN414]MDH4568435.1 hypothetical protein [Pseudomonas sp. BN414]
MIFYSLFEAANKILGIFIFALYARVLGVELFSAFSSTLIIFGYFFELSFFSYQSKHLVDHERVGDKYLTSDEFYCRTKVILITSAIGATLFHLLQNSASPLDIAPLLGVFACIPATFDFVAFNKKKSNYIVVARFLSQVVAVLILLIFYTQPIPRTEIFTVNFAQTLVLTGIVGGLLISSRDIRIKDVYRGLLASRTKPYEIFKELTEQAPVFLSKSATLLVITVELPLLMFYENESHKVFSVANRLALVILPFVHFYLNRNVNKIYQENTFRFFSINSLIAIPLIFASPAINHFILGSEYTNHTFTYNFFLINIGIQAVTSFTFMLSVKNGNSNKYLAGLALPIAFAITSISILNLLGKLDLESLIAVFYIKNILIIFSTSGMRLSQTTASAALILAAPVLNYFLFKIGYFGWFDNNIPKLQSFFLGIAQMPLNKFN